MDIQFSAAALWYFLPQKQPFMLGAAGEVLVSERAIEWQFRQIRGFAPALVRIQKYRRRLKLRQQELTPPRFGECAVVADWPLSLDAARYG
jgi:hypothetical protein